MAKPDQTEALLMEALAQLVAGTAHRTDGALTQANVAKQAGMSRATFNRYPAVVEAWRKARAPADTQYAEDGGKQPRDTLTSLRKDLAEARRQWKAEMDAARQEIMILNAALQQRDETIAALRRTAGKSKVATLPSRRDRKD